MKFIVDAQLPSGIAWILNNKGYDAIHTDDLPDKERTTDEQIRMISLKENRIVVTKDADFLDSYYIQNKPERLLLITTGNIRNNELYKLFANNLQQIVELFETINCIELDNTDIIGHE